MTARVLAIVQARTGSTRLPGKVLAEVAGRPMLGFMLERLAPLAAGGVELVVATSERGDDDAVAAVAAKAGLPAVRGPEADVLGRLALALAGHPADVVVRLTGDCPLADPELVHTVIGAHLGNEADFTSNTLVRTYPDGLDVEVLTADALLAANAEAVEPAEREHVTPFVIRRPRRFHLVQSVTPRRLGRERWTVDTADDLAVIREAVSKLDDPLGASWLDVLAVLGVRQPVGATEMVATPDLEIAHQRGHPYVRAWDLSIAAASRGRAVMTVDQGVGRLALEVREDDRPTAEQAIRSALAADQQVARLELTP